MARGNSTHTAPKGDKPEAKPVDETKDAPKGDKPEAKRPRAAVFGDTLSVCTEHPGRRGYVACGRSFGPEPTVLTPADYTADTFERLTTDALLVVTSV